MAMRNQDRNQMSADVAGTSGDENINGGCHDDTKSKQSLAIELFEVKPSAAIHYSAARGFVPSPVETNNDPLHRRSLLETISRK
jgi:hypothetical protein